MEKYTKIVIPSGLLILVFHFARLQNYSAAVVYDRYVSGYEDEEAYLSAGAIAQQDRLMFWNSSPVVMPWDFRREQR